MTKTILLDKEYDGISLLDIYNDVQDAVETPSVPINEYGFYQGKFICKIEWFDTELNSR